VDLARLGLERPPRTAQETAARGQSTEGARNLVEALSSLLSAQNNFLGVWINYEVQRMNLDLDLGTMKLDHRGLWIDPGPITSKDAEDLPLPEEVPPGVETIAPELRKALEVGSEKGQ